MPKLMVFTACEKVITDNQGLPTLVSIFQRMNIVVSDAPLPPNAVAPIRWAIFTLWIHDASETGMKYTQRIEILAPNGSKFGDATLHFESPAPTATQSKNTVELLGIPICEEGELKIKVWLDEVPGSAAEYLFFITHVKEANERTTSTTH